MAFKMNKFSGFKNVSKTKYGEKSAAFQDNRLKLKTSETDRGGKRKIETESTRVKDEGPTADQFETKVTVTKRGGKVKKVYDSKTGTKTKVKYDKEGKVKKTKTKKTSKKRIEKLAKKSGTTVKDQVREIPMIDSRNEWRG